MRKLLKLRREQLVPWLHGARSGEFVTSSDGSLRIVWPLADGRRWHMLAQLGDTPGAAGGPETLPGTPVYRSHPDSDAVPAWSVHVNIENP